VFSNIVVGTDGSDTAKLAVTLAADLAERHDAVLHLVNAYKVPSGGPGRVQAGPVGVASEEASAEVFKAASVATLAEAANSTRKIKVETHSKRGTPAHAVLGVAEEVGADLIVVGSRGMRGARRMIGSVPNSVAHRAPCHVLIAKTT
jgi:nucleotide-binding universal stress UspA family protein